MLVENRGLNKRPRQQPKKAADTTHCQSVSLLSSASTYLRPVCNGQSRTACTVWVLDTIRHHVRQDLCHHDVATLPSVVSCTFFTSISNDNEHPPASHTVWLRFLWLRNNIRPRLLRSRSLLLLSSSASSVAVAVVAHQPQLPPQYLPGRYPEQQHRDVRLVVAECNWRRRRR